VIGENPDNIEKLWWKMWDTTTRALGGITHRALAGIDNALWDIKGKRLGVPVYELLGGRYRDKIRLYWSHCGTHRVFRPKVVQKPKIDSYDGIKKLGMEVVEEGFTALKTNIFNPESLDDSGPGSYREGIGTVVMDKQTLKDAVHLIRVFREAVFCNKISQKSRAL
jgi:L-alanine-DL-glutamate epimerase-like enolase superfamily enzyme